MSEWCTWKCFLIGLVVGVVIGVAIMWLACEQGWIKFPSDIPPEPLVEAIGGTVWRDLNGNCIVDDGPEALLVGVGIEIEGPGGSFLATTDSGGAYRVPGIKVPGLYTVRIVTPVSHLPSCDSDDKAPGPGGPTTPNQVIVDLGVGRAETASFGFD